MSSRPQNSISQKPMNFLDELLCQEEDLSLDCEENSPKNVGKESLFDKNEVSFDDDEVLNLLSKEKDTLLSVKDLVFSECLMKARKEAIDWLIRACAHFGFAAKTLVLAFNYFDRFLFSPFFNREKPWMCQLIAVACLSLAVKVEETQARLLFDLQVEKPEHVFEAATIMRMELFVLSALKWKVTPVTPFSYFDYVVRRLGLEKSEIHWEFLVRCERLLLSFITDPRFLGYLPSIVAAATMCIVFEDFEPCSAMEYQDQLKGFFEISKEEVDDCLKLIKEASTTYGYGECQYYKRKYWSRPGSPNCIVDAYFSGDSSNDSWALASSVSSSPEPPYKKSRAQGPKIRLAPLNRVSIGVLSSSR